MTTLIIDFNTKAIYTDSRSTSSKDGTVAKEFDEDCNKIYQLVNGKVLVGCGCYNAIKKAADNLLSNKGLDFLPKTKEYATIYIVSKKGGNIEIEQYETKKKSWLTGNYTWSRVYKQLSTKDSWITDGSGRDYAAGALKQGATPEEAINVASMLDEFTNNIVQKIEL